MNTKYCTLLIVSAIASFQSVVLAQAKGLRPLPERVNVQTDSARLDQIINGKWVAVGIKRPYAIMLDSTLMFDGKPSFRFELKGNDNTLSGYKEGDTKGRAELSYCYATAADFAGQPRDAYGKAQRMKTVYHHGKGIAPQGSSRDYTFSVYVPAELSPDATTIFAQWHGMPDRRLVQTPEGEAKMLSVEDFLALEDKMIFNKNVGHEKVEGKDKKGNATYKAGKATGWLVEQGGYPPLAFTFSNGYFYIKANSDRKWLTDKDDRCSANPATAKVMQPVKSEYKASTIAYKMPFGDFPKNTWVTFNVHIDWTKYGGQKETILKSGMLDVKMTYSKNGKTVAEKIVNSEPILIGRNDDDGYYFKFGIYRVGNSTIPVQYNLAGYSEK